MKRRCALLLLAACHGAPSTRATRASSALYVRSDSDDTTVVSPRVRVAGEVGGQTTVEAEYSVDAWSGASVDIMTAATGRVRETRHEAAASVGSTGGDVRLSGSYRYSSEPDYHSHGGTARLAVDLAQQNTTLTLDAFGGIDEVGRAGDRFFAAALARGGGRVTWVQVLDARTLAELSWESSRLEGFQASPYRWVAIGGDGRCASLAPFCVPERVPGDRWRHAAGLRARRALGAKLSLGVAGRFYVDSWGIQSLTVEPDLALRLGDGVLDLRYRYYTQGDADFYRARYADMSGTEGFVTRDRKLSAFYAHEVGVAYVHRFELGHQVLEAGVRTTMGLIDYLDFIGLDQAQTLEVTTSVGIELD